MTKLTTEQLKDLLGKVTQGEWVADELNKSGLPSAYINAADGYPVARAVGVVSEFETEANATLIALAPTLAAEVVALREAMSALIDMNDNYSPFGGEMYHDRIDRTWDNARQAISKK